MDEEELIELEPEELLVLEPVLSPLELLELVIVPDDELSVGSLCAAFSSSLEPQAPSTHAAIAAHINLRFIFLVESDEREAKREQWYGISVGARPT